MSLFVPGPCRRYDNPILSSRIPRFRHRRTRARGPYDRRHRPHRRPGRAPRAVRHGTWRSPASSSRIAGSRCSRPTPSTPRSARRTRSSGSPRCSRPRPAGQFIGNMPVVEFDGDDARPACSTSCSSTSRRTPCDSAGTATSTCAPPTVGASSAASTTFMRKHGGFDSGHQHDPLAESE